MTDKETSLEFVERIRTLDSLADLTITERVDLLKLAKTAALIDEYRLGVMPYQVTNVFDPGKSWVWDVSPHGDEPVVINADLHTAVRAVADKIKDGK